VKTTVVLNLRPPAPISPGPRGLQDAAMTTQRFFSVAAQTCRTLEHGGWVGRYHQHAVYFQHPEVDSEDAAVLYLMSVGLYPSDLHITSEWDVWAVPKKTYADEGVFVI